MQSDALFEETFTASLDGATHWINNPRSRYADFGDSLEDEVHFMLQQTVLPIELVETTSVAEIQPKLCKGVHLKQISVPEARRRKGHATRLLTHLLAATRAAGCDYLFVESVLTDEMHTLMRSLPDFVVAQLQPNCYIAVLSKKPAEDK